MKVLRFFPLTFLAGPHGFALFAPYFAFVMVTVMVFRSKTRVVIAAPAGAKAQPSIPQSLDLDLLSPA